MIIDTEDSKSDVLCGCCEHKEAFLLPKQRILQLLKDWFLYFKSRRWGLQMLIRLTIREKVFLRHFIVFCLGLILSLFWQCFIAYAIPDFKPRINSQSPSLNEKETSKKYLICFV